MKSCRLPSALSTKGNGFSLGRVCAKFLKSWERKDEWSVCIYHHNFCRYNNVNRNSTIIRLRDLNSINLHVHETLWCVIASQTQVLSDRSWWKYVVSCQHLFAHIVAYCAKQLVFYELLCVLCQTSQMSFLPIGISVQDDIQGFFAQAIRSHCAKHCHPRYTVPLLPNGDFATVKDQGNRV